MTKIDGIAEALVKECYLARENIEAAAANLTQYLSSADRENYRKVLADSRFQERIICKSNRKTKPKIND